VEINLYVRYTLGKLYFGGDAKKSKSPMGHKANNHEEQQYGDWNMTM
jgi:hypothetical protein